MRLSAARRPRLGRSLPLWGLALLVACGTESPAGAGSGIDLGDVVGTDGAGSDAVGGADADSATIDVSLLGDGSETETDAAADDAADGAAALDASADVAPDGAADAEEDAEDAAAADVGDAVDPDAAATDVEDAAADAGGDVEAPPVLVVPGPPVQASVEVLDKGVWTTALPVTGDEVLVHRVGKDGPEWLLLGPLAGQTTPHVGPAGAPLDARAVGGARLLRHALGLAGLVGKSWLASPLGAALPGPITAWRTIDGGKGLAMISAGDLWLWRAGKLGKVPLADKVVGEVALADGCAAPGGAALWVADANQLRSVRVDASFQAEVHVWVVDRSFDGLVCDGGGVLWAATEGELVSRGVDGSFTTWALGVPVDDAFGADGKGGLWLRLGKALWRVDGDVFRQVLGVGDGAGWRTDAAGRLVVARPEGVLRAATSPPPPKPKVSWKADIAPIYEAKCALCHGPEGVSTKLDGAKKWQDKFETILYLTESGAMPLPPKTPLDSAAIATLKAWKKDGFQP